MQRNAVCALEVFTKASGRVGRWLGDGMGGTVGLPVCACM
jgi:hypothetical protein